jgi:nifR3 family TIM-barrel protein
MRPIGAQICGSDPRIAAEAAKIVEDLGFDVIDLNCGCPVDKVVKDGSGSALLLHPEKIAEILFAIKSVVSIPVTAKVRIGWDKNTIPIYEVLSYVEQSGASLLTIHGRTREQGYSGTADWEYIRECKKKAKIPIFGNGDVFDHLAAKKMFEETSCDGVMVARGMLGKPWLAEDIFQFFQGKEPHKKSYVEQLDMLILHYDYISEYQKNPVYALYDMRRVGCWYLKSYPGMKVLRVSINEARTAEEAYQIVYQARRDALQELANQESTLGCL